MVIDTSQILGRGVVALLRPDCSLSAMRFDHVVGERVQLRRAHLSDCEFHGAVLIGADLRDARLERVKFVDCHLAGARFENTQLDEVSFTDCNLVGSSFGRTNLDSVELNNVDRAGWQCDEALWHRIPGYEIEKLLGESADARIFRARRRVRVRPVVLKIFKRTTLNARKLAERLAHNEGPLAKALRAGHVARVVDFGTFTGLGEPYIATELLRGQTLAEVLQNGFSQSMDDAQRVELFRQAASGLAAIHRAARRAGAGNGRPALAHGDVRPSNLFLAGRGRRRTVKLIDFGVARLIRTYPREITRSVADSVAYDSPETLGSGVLGGPTADVYALGVTMYEAFCGTHPYLSLLRATCEQRRDGILSRAAAVKFIHETVPRLPFDELTPTRLQPILRRCMQVLPHLRYKDGTELESTLGTL